MSITDKIRKFTNRIKNTDGEYDLVSYDTDASTVYVDYENKKTLDTKITEMDEANNSKIAYNDIDNTLFVELEKVYDGFGAQSSKMSQGLAYDSKRNLFYIAYFDKSVSDRSKRYICINVISGDTFESELDFIQQQYAGHCNNLNYIKRNDKEFLVLSAGNNTKQLVDDYSQVGIIQIDDHPVSEGKPSFTFKTPVKMTDPSWCILPFIGQSNPAKTDSNGNIVEPAYDYNISYLSFPALDQNNGSPYAYIMCCVEGNTSKYYTTGRLELPYANGISQGGEIKNGIVYKLYSYYSNNATYGKNSIQIFGLNGSYYNTVYLKYDTPFEAEDICVLDDGTLYVLDSCGGIYRSKTNILYFINPNYKYGFRYPITAMSEMILYDYSMDSKLKDVWSNGTEKWAYGKAGQTSAGSQNFWMLESFSISPYVYTRHLNKIYGNMCVNGQMVQITHYRIPYINTSGSYSYTHYISGQSATYSTSGQLILSKLTYKLTTLSDNIESYSFSVDTENTWIKYGTTTIKGNSVLENQNCLGNWYAGTLIGNHIGDISMVSINV